MLSGTVCGIVTTKRPPERFSGVSKMEIAERLGIALRTVEVHRAGALKKIGTRDPSAIKRLLETAGV